jgi:phage major head subunit gpT-like protein
MATPFNMISRDAQLALTEFSTAFDSAFTLADVNEWAKSLGLVYNTKYKATFPVPISAAGFRKREGEDKFRDLFEKSFSVTPYEWQDGVRAHHLKLEAPDFIDWAGEPQRMALEAKRVSNTMIAAMLESAAGAGPTLEWDGKTLFADDHPSNPMVSGSTAIDNTITGMTALNIAALESIENRFATFVGLNGKPMSRHLTHLIVPRSMRITAEKVLRSDMQYNSALAEGANTNLLSQNLWQGVQLVVADELTTSGVFYALDATGPKPWVVVDPGATEEIVFDKSSDLYKTSGYLALSEILTLGFGAALPHSIIRCAL